MRRMLAASFSACDWEGTGTAIPIRQYSLDRPVVQGY